MVPLLIMPLDQALLIQMKSDFGIDRLLGSLTLKWDGRFKDVTLSQIQSQRVGW